MSTDVEEIVMQLSANTGEEYHKLHSNKQDFNLTDARMRYYENQALTALYTLLDSKLPRANPREWADNKTQVAWTIGYEKAIDEVRAMLKETLIGGEK